LINAPEDKIGILSKYRVSLVIENEMTYLSEKLFDAWFAGCIPVYVGPEISDYGIPRSLVFQAEPNLRSIENQINRAIQSDYLTFQHELAEWLNSSQVKERHQGEQVMTRALERCIEEYLRFVNLNRK
jgi:carbamoylphosphate synthase small subunit